MSGAGRFDWIAALPLPSPTAQPLRPWYSMDQLSRRIWLDLSEGSPWADPSAQGTVRRGLGHLGLGLRNFGARALAVVLPAVLMALMLAQPGAGWAFEKVDYTLTNQSGQDFHGQALANSSFAGVAGRGANFAGADLSGAILTQAAFPAGDFNGTDLTDALMDRADFSDTDLRGAILRGAIASGSRFGGARIENADFSDALIDRASQRQLCRTASGTNPVSGVGTRESLGC